MPPNIPLPPEAAAAVARGQTIAAIKILRAATGMSLKDAKDAVEAHAMRIPAPPPGAGATTGFVFPEVAAAAIARGEFLEAIALLRKANSRLDLATAKEAVDTFRRGQAQADPTKHHMPPRHAARVPTVVAGDSGRHGPVLLAVAVALAAVVLWFVGGQ
jgi:hypothetical protein